MKVTKGITIHAGNVHKVFSNVRKQLKRQEKIRTLEEYLAAFKPEFGNLNHLEVLKTLKKLNSKKKSLEESRRAAATITTVRREIAELEKTLLSKLKRCHSTSTN